MDNETYLDIAKTAVIAAAIITIHQLICYAALFVIRFGQPVTANDLMGMSFIINGATLLFAVAMWLTYETLSEV